MMKERFLLALERIREIKEEKRLEGAFQAYFEQVSSFLLALEQEKKRLEEGKLNLLGLEELKEQNRAIYEDILPGNYENSFANPARAEELLGKDYGQLLSALYAELYSIPVYLYENRLAAVVIRLELFLEIYGVFLESGKAGLPEYPTLRDIYFWFAHDYQEEILGQEVQAQFDPKENWAGRLLDRTDIADLRYLYAYGEYVSENELLLAEYLNRLPEETV